MLHITSRHCTYLRKFCVTDTTFLSVYKSDLLFLLTFRLWFSSKKKTSLSLHNTAAMKFAILSATLSALVLASPLAIHIDKPIERCSSEETFCGKYLIDRRGESYILISLLLFMIIQLTSLFSLLFLLLILKVTLQGNILWGLFCLNRLEYKWSSENLLWAALWIWCQSKQHSLWMHQWLHTAGTILWAGLSVFGRDSGPRSRRGLLQTIPERLAWEREWQPGQYSDWDLGG